MMPPNRAATIEMATPVARKCVGKTSVIKQSSAAFAQLMTALNVALTIRFSILLVTKYMTAEQRPAEKVPAMRKNLRPSLSMPRTCGGGKLRLANLFNERLF